MQLLTSWQIAKEALILLEEQVNMEEAPQCIHHIVLTINLKLRRKYGL